MACCLPIDRFRAPTMSSSNVGHPENVRRDFVLHRSSRYVTEELNAKPGFLAGIVPTVCQFPGVTFPEVNRDSKINFESISEEEALFVKALTRGRGLLEFTIGRLGGQIVIPGNVARRLYHTHGSPTDFTRLMIEENGITIGVIADDKVNARAKHLSQGKGFSSDVITLNGHVVNDLQKNAVTPRNDSFNFHPSVMPSGEGSLCEFERPAARVIAIRHRKEIVREVRRRNQMNLYAEFGVRCVHIRGRYVVHTYELSLLPPRNRLLEELVGLRVLVVPKPPMP